MDEEDEEEKVVGGLTDEVEEEVRVGEKRWRSRVADGLLAVLIG